MDDDRQTPLSALNHYAYCPRRCGLIHMEGELADNVHTARGFAEHDRVDTVAHEVSRAGARVEFALPVWSDRLGLIGKCDVVELWPDGTVYPVEYKHGKRRAWVNDDLQLGAQALCLEEMTGRPVPRGAIFHHGSRRRREVHADSKLRDLVEQAVAHIRAMFASGVLPPALDDRHCGECSLRDLCQPSVLAARERWRDQVAALFQPEP